MKKLILPTLAASILSSMPAAAQIFQDPFNPPFETMVFAPHHVGTRYMTEPRMDVADLKDKIEVKAELPGIDEKDVTVSVENGILTLSGERKEEVEEQNKDYYIKETSSGSFSRSIRLPKNIDESKIDAIFKKGVLTINIPKTDIMEETIKKIPIKTEE
ncbi:MAG: Hsp20/alpha crystallin family protein [Alphaproteobacteria bacterium]|nr:Hsp20/alpha crystallin family protein [Alphaproteobacteria bacterium]